MSVIEKKSVAVHGHRISYTEAGQGDPIVFLHGNPTSSYLWRNVIPAATGFGRCLAPDLLGMGDSDKLAHSGPQAYSFAEHRHHMDAWFEAVGAHRGTVLVLHDWGSALGFDWARRHPACVRGIAYAEAIVRPLSQSDLAPPIADLFEALRSPAGEKLVLDDNLFIEGVLASSTTTPLAPEVLEEYRRPFAAAGEDRQPMLSWARQVPIDGRPADVAEVVTAYSDWLTTSPIPKLFVNADPGASLIGAAREFCRGWPSQTEVTLPGGHFLPEDAGPAFGQALTIWLRSPSNISMPTRR